MIERLFAGRYELERPLGHGAVSVVDLAHDVQLDRDVALKRLAENPARDEDVRARFLREARLAGRIAHPNVVRVYDGTPSLQDRTCGTGIVSPALAARWAAGGFVGRASGRAFDARRSTPYPPYNNVELAIPLYRTGDVDARVWVRVREIEASVALLRGWLAELPEGPVRAELPRSASAREGTALVEGFRGDVLVWLRLAPDGRIDRCYARDPSWLQWPLLEAAVENNIVADFPLCNKSFNCSYSGHDL